MLHIAGPVRTMTAWVAAGTHGMDKRPAVAGFGSGGAALRAARNYIYWESVWAATAQHLIDDCFWAGCDSSSKICSMREYVRGIQRIMVNSIH